YSVEPSTADGRRGLIEIRPGHAGEELLRIAGEGTPLAVRHSLYFQRVSIAVYPDEYETRLIDTTPRSLRKLRLMAMEVHDVVLAKLSRNSSVDRSDVKFLAERGIISRRVLEERFEAELRHYVLNEAREKQTLELWLAEYFGDGGS